MDTAARYMREMNRDLGEKIDLIKDDTSAIRTSLSSLDDLRIKYEELSRDILEIKQALKEKGIV
jgi:vacuolar-type H+-ATPase catalytic subunit A/Vma1